MPPKMVKCQMCGQMVTKRKSWDLQALGSKKTGRVCKKHEQIREIVEEMRVERLMEMDMGRASRALHIMQGVAFVQIQHSFFGMPVFLAYEHLKRSGCTPDMIAEIKAQVAEQGGPQMSDEQQMMAVIAAADLRKRGLVA